MTLTATKSGTVGVSGSFDLNTIVAGVQASVSTNVDVSTYAAIGDSVTDPTVQPGQYFYGDYGVWRFKTYGDYETLNLPGLKAGDSEGTTMAASTGCETLGVLLRTRHGLSHQQHGRGSAATTP